MAQAIFAFPGQEMGDLSFKVGDMIKIVSKDDSGWWKGRNLNTGQMGDFPYNYVKEVAKGGMKSNTTAQAGSAASDTIKSVKITHQKGTNNFKVDLTTGSGASVSGVKALGDFRALENDLTVVISSIDISLPPIWADKYYCTETLSKRRARVLETYIVGIINKKVPTANYVLATWVNPKNKYNAGDAEKQEYANKVVPARKKAQHASMMSAFQSVYPLALVQFDWDPADLVELQLVQGEVIAVKKKETTSEGWWEGETSDGQQGLFPANYVKMLNADEARDVILGSFKTSGAAQEKPQPKKEGKRTEKNFAVPTFKAFDKLLTVGFAMVNGANDFASSASKKAIPGDEVTLDYVGYIWDCQNQLIYEFSNSDADGNMAFVVSQGQVVQGLELAVRQMGESESARVIIAPEKGYGDAGKPPIIPPSVHIVYDITVRSIAGATIPAAPPMATGQSKPGSSMSDLAGAFADANAVGGTSRGAWAPVQNRQTRKHGTVSAAGGGGGIAVPVSKPAGGGGKKYDLKTLQEIVRNKKFEEYGVDPSFIESYLKDRDFAKAFNCTLNDFLRFPRWKQAKLKRDARLI